MRKLIAVHLAALMCTACTVERPKQVPPSIIFAEPIIVFFDADSWSLSEEARAVIHEAIPRAKQFDCGVLLAVGNTDATGSEKGNAQLSLRCAEVVRNELLRDGYRGSVSFEGRDSQNLLKPDDSGKPEPLNRRTQIDFECRRD